MIELIWDDKFKRIFKKWSQKHPDLMEQFRNKMELFVIDPFHPSLKRLIFRFVDKEKKKILLIDLGTHNEVY